LVLSQSCGGRKVSPPISSVLTPTIAASNSPLVRGGRLPTQAVGSCLPPQNDSGLPAPRPCIVARTSSPRATSGTTSPPTCGPLPPWPARDVCAPPAGDRRGPTQHLSAPRSGPPPPAENPQTNCPACRCLPAAAVRRW